MGLGIPRAVLLTLFVSCGMAIDANATPPPSAALGQRGTNPMATAAELPRPAYGTRSVYWDHDSPCDVVEYISDLGNGQFEYSYVLTNNDSDGIWHLLIYTSFDILDTTPFIKSDWRSWHHGIAEVYPEYRPYNIDPTLTHVASSAGPGYNPDWISTNPIVVGETVGGFSYQSSYFDPQPKLYIYELQGNSTLR